MTPQQKNDREFLADQIERTLNASTAAVDAAVLGDFRALLQKWRGGYISGLPVATPGLPPGELAHFPPMPVAGSVVESAGCSCGDPDCRYDLPKHPQHARPTEPDSEP